MRQCRRASSTEKCYHDSYLLKSFSSITTTTRLSSWIFWPAIRGTSEAMTEKQCQEVFLATKCHLNLLLHSLWYQCPPVSQYVFEHPGDGCVTFYKTWPRFRRTMALRLLSCRAPGTQLIIYLACVYLCWTRLSGGGSRERKADTILPASVRGAQNPEGPPALLGRALLFTDAHVRETEVAAMQQCQQGLWSDLHTNTRFNWH